MVRRNGGSPSARSSERRKTCVEGRVAVQRSTNDGVFQVTVRVTNPGDSSRFFEGAVLDRHRAPYSLVPEDRLEEIGITPSLLWFARQPYQRREPQGGTQRPTKQPLRPATASFEVTVRTIRPEAGAPNGWRNAPDFEREMWWALVDSNH